MYMCQCFNERNGQIEESRFFHSISECMMYGQKYARNVPALNGVWDMTFHVAVYSIEFSTPYHLGELVPLKVLKPIV